MQQVLSRVGGLLLVGALSVGVHGCKSLATADGRGQQLLEASRAAGVEVNAAEVFSVSSRGETFTAAPIVGWDTTPATELRRGVNIAFAYLESSNPKTPTGYYTLRAFADVVEVGTTSARIQLVDRSGNVAGELAGEAEIHSLTVPAQPAFPNSFITTAPALRPNFPPWFWHRCPNGVCVRHPFFTFTRGD